MPSIDYFLDRVLEAEPNKMVDGFRAEPVSSPDSYQEWLRDWPFDATATASEQV